MEYEYRAVERRLPDGEWRQIHTNRSAGRPYRTVGAAKVVISREQRRDSERRYWNGDGRYEYKIQRRPVGDWEDLPESE